MGDFVRPEVVRLSLTNGRWVDVKKRLTAGEARKMYGRLIKDLTPGEAPHLDPEYVGLTKLLAYVIGWSFVDDGGRPVPFSPAALDNTDPDLYAEMIQAVDAHIAVQDAERETEKNGLGDASETSAISSSVA